MAGLADILRSDWGSGYRDRRKEIAVEETQNLQQATGLMGILAQQQQVQARQQAVQREQALRGALAALPLDATEDQVLKAVQPFAGADDLLKTITSSRDRRAALEAANVNRADNREQRTFELEQRGAQARELQQERLQAQATLAKQRSEDQALSQAERNQARMDMIRLAASLRAPPAPRAPIATDQGLFTQGPHGLQPMMNPNQPDQQLRPPSVVSGGNQQALALRRMYEANPQVKLANSLEPRVAPTAEYIASVGKGMGNSVSDAELVKLWLMTTHPKGDQISNLDYREIAKMPDLAGRIANVAGNFVFGKTLDSDTRNSMWNSISQKYKSTAAQRDKIKADATGRGRAMGIDESLIFYSEPK